MEMKNRSELREVAMKALYQVYIYENTDTKYEINEIIKSLLEIENEFVNSLVNGVIENQNTISELANKYLVDWDIDRLSKVDKAIISLGIYELKYTDTPSVVSINEAIELSKKYSDEKVTKMINATLDKIFHSEEE
ncbi:MAG: transcription antitermination factor NusB [Firmicutes bacterium]|nr:transcription antitermination factor NusB [Bacillota bacterium]